MKRVTQHQGIFYQLYKARFENPEQYIPIWKLIGEIFIKEISQWVFISYEVSARMSELYRKNSNLFQRIEIEGKTGAKYFAYRININVVPEDILDIDLKKFYKLIKSREQAIFVPNVPANK